MAFGMHKLIRMGVSLASLIADAYPWERLMQKPQRELVCSLCDKRVTRGEDTCVDKSGKVVHTDCRAQQILQGDSAVAA
jgi:hypothetical protein